MKYWNITKIMTRPSLFIDIVVYYGIFITFFPILTAPIFGLFRIDVEFLWSLERWNAMDELKRRLAGTPILITLDFSPSNSMIILDVDASTLTGW